MQRILSVETSRSANNSTEVVSKRICCSFILTVAFFAIIGGFILGRFVADRSLQQVRQDLTEISQKLIILDTNLKATFHSRILTSANCSNEVLLCDHFKFVKNIDINQRTILQTLDLINNCFNFG